MAPVSGSEGEYTPSGTSSMNLLTGVVNSLFSFKPAWNFMKGKARQMMVDRGDAIGYPWAARLEELKKYDWAAEVEALRNKDLTYPDYYTVPFHAYDKGNLSLEAALEVELAARAVHATVFDVEREKLDPEGDQRLRDSYNEKMLPMLKVKPAKIVDLGCSTGLSTMALHKAFPDADITGIDLSEYFVAVANFNLRQQNAEKGEELPIRYFHGAAERTGLPAKSVDLVSMCLVCHELPRAATKEIIEEAHRILRPGGALCIMEMNPHSPLLQRMVNNVFAFTAFKATEPYFDDYRTFPIEEAIEERGFEPVQQTESTPRHRSMVAHKR